MMCVLAPSDERVMHTRESGSSDLMFEVDKYTAAALAQPRNVGAVADTTYVGEAFALCASIVTSASRRVRGSSTAAFDEYLCTEKLDYTRLACIVDALRFGRIQCETAIRNLDALSNHSYVQKQQKKLQRCQALDLVASQLLATLPKPVDANGRVSVSVRYEERDAASNGRLFAVGQMVHTTDHAPRVMSLQGIQSDLRAALVGEFAHDIDCENSEFRLIWSLAKKYGLRLQVVEGYCTRRTDFLQKIVQAHGVDVAAAKRLPNIIASGGQYRTWMRKHGVTEESNPLKTVMNRMHMEIRELQDHLVHHKDFEWLEAERQHMRDIGKREPFNLMPTIVRYCEREVLRIVHRCFFECQWDVLALVFDGLIAEPGSAATGSLAPVMQRAEDRCRQEGWEVKLAEKPLHGLQDAPIQTIVDAYRIVRETCPELGPLFAVGEDVHISGYTTARVEAYVHGGQYHGKVRVRYKDGSTYHVDPQVMCHAGQPQVMRPPVKHRTTQSRTEQLHFELAQMGVAMVERKAWKGCGQYDFDALDRKVQALVDISERELEAIRTAMEQICVPDGFKAHVCRFCPMTGDTFGHPGSPDKFDFVLPGSLTLSLDLRFYWLYTLVNAKERRHRSEQRLSVTFQLHFVDPTTGRVVSERPNFDLPAPTKPLPWCGGGDEFAAGPAISEAAREMLEQNGTLSIDPEAKYMISDETYRCKGLPTYLILVCSDIERNLVLDRRQTYSGLSFGAQSVPTVFEPPDWFEKWEYVREWHEEMARLHPGCIGSENPKPIGLRNYQLADMLDHMFPLGLRSVKLVETQALEGSKSEKPEPTSEKRGL